jgi:integrase
MSLSHEGMAALVNRFVKDRRVRTKAVEFNSAIRQFRQAWLKGLASVNQRAIRKSLRAQLKTAPLAKVVYRALLFNRFLDWSAEQGMVVANPLAELRRQYDCRSTSAIVRALASANPQQALQALRPPQPYSSHLGDALRDHVTRMRSLGFRYSHEGDFVRFDRFLQARKGAETESLSRLIQEYSAEADTPGQRLKRLRLANTVARALTRSGIPTPGLAPSRSLVNDVARLRCHPYIYTPEQIRDLLRAARSFPGRAAPLRRSTLYTMLVVAYCAGLRLSEIVGLELQDVDLNEGAIDVRDTKFFKSRRLPLSSSAVAALNDYITIRRKTGAPLDLQAPLFVHTHGGYSVSGAGALLRRVIVRAGLSKGPGTGGPRIHDIRHTFVVHRMTAWYREGINPQSRLQYLATYLGHLNIHSTLVYLTITQELLQHASARFRSVDPNVLKAIHGGSQH